MLKTLTDTNAFRRVKLALAGGLAVATFLMVAAGPAAASTSGSGTLDGCTAGIQLKSYINSSGYRLYYASGTLTCPNRHAEFAVQTTLKVTNQNGSVVSFPSGWKYYWNSYGMGSNALPSGAAYGPAYFQGLEQVYVSDDGGRSWTYYGYITTGAPTWLG